MTNEEIGHLLPRPGDQVLANCAECPWSWQGSRLEAEDLLRRHADYAHPAPIVIYRETP